MKKDSKFRTIFIIANSSWYLFHYRKYLLHQLKLKDLYNIVTISPMDNNTKELSKLSLNIPWRISRSGNKNIFRIFISLLRLILIFRSLKPSIVHSHTLKTNFLTSIAAFIFGTPCIISFAGLGQISNARGIKKDIFILIIKIIGIISYRDLASIFFLKNERRTSFIFQNKNDMKFISQIIKIPKSNSHLIFGSGVPDHFLTKVKQNSWIEKNNSVLKKDAIKFHLIYMSRLLKSKGIITFLEIANYFEELNATVFGGVDPSSKDSLTNDDIKKLKINNKKINFYGFRHEPLLNQDYSYPILVVPSKYGEGLPRGIIEALALKIPVISSKEATCNLFDESLIYISKENKISSYIECINNIIEDYTNGKLKNKLNNGNKYVRENLLESQIVNQTISVYGHMEKINYMK